MFKKLAKSFFIDPVVKSDVDFLKKVALFKGVSDRALAHISLIVFKKKYAENEKVYSSGQEANVLYIIKDGKVKLQNGVYEKTLSSGGFFGEISLMDNRKHDSSASAVSHEAELYLLYRVKLEDILESDLKSGMRIMKNLASMFSSKLVCSEI